MNKPTQDTARERVIAELARNIAEKIYGNPISQMNMPPHLNSALMQMCKHEVYISQQSAREVIAKEVSALYAAGYAEGLEDASKVAELGLVGIALNNEPTIGDIRAVAAAIRKLKDGR